MSIELMTAVWKTDIGPATKRLVLLALADSANDEGACWPSMSTIARKAACGVSTAREAVAALEADGFLVREIREVPGKRNQSNLYRLDPARIRREVPPESGGSAAEIRRQNPKEIPKEGTEDLAADAAGDDGALFEKPAPASVPAAPKEPTLNQRANALAGAHYERLGKMGNVPAFAKIIKQALNAGHADSAVDAALAYIAGNQWTLTGERLANTLRGGPKLPSAPPPQPSAVAPGAEMTAEQANAWLVERYRAADAEGVSKRTGVPYHAPHPGETPKSKTVEQFQREYAQAWIKGNNQALRMALMGIKQRKVQGI